MMKKSESPEKKSEPLSSEEIERLKTRVEELRRQVNGIDRETEAKKKPLLKEIDETMEILMRGV